MPVHAVRLARLAVEPVPGPERPVITLGIVCGCLIAVVIALAVWVRLQAVTIRLLTADLAEAYRMLREAPLGRDGD